LPLQSLVLASSSPDPFASETAMPGAHPSAEFAPQPFEEPIRAELFGVERLEQHAESLAAAQPVMSELEKGRRLLPRVEDNGRVLRDRKSTRLNSSHVAISYAVFCLKKKNGRRPRCRARPGATGPAW